MVRILVATDKETALLALGPEYQINLNVLTAQSQDLDLAPLLGRVVWVLSKPGTTMRSRNVGTLITPCLTQSQEAVESSVDVRCTIDDGRWTNW